MLYLTLIISCIFCFASGVPCSPCDDDSECLPYVEYCQLPNALFDVPDFILDKEKSQNHELDSGRYQYE